MCKSVRTLRNQTPKEKRDKIVSMYLSGENVLYD